MFKSAAIGMNSNDANVIRWFKLLTNKLTLLVAAINKLRLLLLFSLCSRGFDCSQLEESYQIYKKAAKFTDDTMTELMTKTVKMLKSNSKRNLNFKHNSNLMQNTGNQTQKEKKYYNCNIKISSSNCAIYFLNSPTTDKFI